MTTRFTRRAMSALCAAALATPTMTLAQDKITLRMSTPASETDQRSVALAGVFAPAVAGNVDVHDLAVDHVVALSVEFIF